MGFAAHSDLFVRYAFWTASISFLLAGFTLLFIVLLRFSLSLHERRKQRMLDTWRPLLARVLVGEAVDFPAVPANVLMDFLYLWLHFHESLRGEARQALNALLHAQQLLVPMCRILKRGGVRQQLIVATALGHAHCREAWEQLAAMAQGNSPALSITAARALIAIDAEAAAGIVLPLIVRRRDWSPARLAVMLKEANPMFAERFLQMVAEAAASQAPYLVRLLHLVEAMGLNRRLPFLAELLRTSDQPEILGACLRMLNDPMHLDLVRQHTRHADWVVRVQAANALRRLGGREDLPILLQLLAAPEWWVRYRAAQAIADAPYLQPGELRQLQVAQADRYARDMLQQVMAERGVA